MPNPGKGLRVRLSLIGKFSAFLREIEKGQLEFLETNFALRCQFLYLCRRYAHLLCKLPYDGNTGVYKLVNVLGIQHPGSTGFAVYRNQFPEILSRSSRNVGHTGKHIFQVVGFLAECKQGFPGVQNILRIKYLFPGERLQAAHHVRRLVCAAQKPFKLPGSDFGLLCKVNGKFCQLHNGFYGGSNQGDFCKGSKEVFKHLFAGADFLVYFFQANPGFFGRCFQRFYTAV